MNNEQNPNIENTPTETNMPANNPAPTPQNDANGSMTTAVVNPDFMQEVENLTPAPAPESVPESNPVQAAPIMEAPIVPNQQPAPVVNEEPKKKKGKNKGLLIFLIILAVIILAIGGYAAYLFFGVSPKKAHDDVIDEIFTSATGFAEKLMMSNYKADAKTIKSKSILSFDSNLNELSMLKNYSFEINSGIDKENNFVNSNFAVLENNKQIINGNVYFINDKAYFDSLKLYNSVIEVGDFELNIEETLDAYEVLDSDKLVHLLDTLKKGLKDGFDENKFTRKLEDVKLNGKEVKAFNNSYAIEEADAYSMIKSILTAIKNDDESIETIVEFVNDVYSSSLFTVEGYDTPSQITKEDVLKTIDSAIAQVTDVKLSGSSSKILFNVYTDIITNKVIGVKLISVEDSETLNFLEYSVDGDTSKIHIGDSDGSSFAFDVTTKASKSDYKFTINGTTLITGTVEYSDNKASLSMNLDMSSIVPNLSSVGLTIISEEKDNSENTELKVSVDNNGELYEVSMKLDSTIAYDETITKPSVSSSVPLDQVDQKTLQDNMLSIIEGTDLQDLLGDYIDLNEVEDEPSYDPDIEFSENCDEAINCDCDGDICNCEYLKNGWKSQAIVCPNPNN